MASAMVPSHLPPNAAQLYRAIMLGSSARPLILMIQKSCSDYVQYVTLDASTLARDAIVYIRQRVYAATDATFYADPTCKQYIDFTRTGTLVAVLIASGLRCVYPVTMVPEANYLIYMAVPDCCRTS